MKQYGTILKTKKRLPWSPSLGALKNDPWLILPWLIYGEQLVYTMVNINGYHMVNDG